MGSGAEWRAAMNAALGIADDGRRVHVVTTTAKDGRGEMSKVPVHEFPGVEGDRSGLARSKSEVQADFERQAREAFPDLPQPRASAAYSLTEAGRRVWPSWSSK